MIWAGILPCGLNPAAIPLSESFDTGGHPFLATRLIFDMRKVLAVEAPLRLVFDQPTIAVSGSGSVWECGVPYWSHGFPLGVCLA